MRSCAGVLAGLVVGAALGFAALAVAALVDRDTAGCALSAPAGWLVRAEIPRAVIEDELVQGRLTFDQGAAVITAVEPLACGRLLVRARWEAAAGWSIPSLGLELRVRAGEDSPMAVRPLRLWFGRLPLCVGWLPEAWIEPVVGPLSEAAGEAMRGQLGKQDLGLCGVSGWEGYLVVYLCGT